MHRHLLYIHAIYLAFDAYVPNLVDISVCGTYLAVTGETEVAVGCVLVYICKKKLGPHVHIVCILSGLYLECGSHIYSVIYVEYVHISPCCLLDACGIYMCIHYPYIDVEYLAYIAYMPSNYINIM